MFRVGQKVVCVDASDLPECKDGWAPGSAPQVGLVYTVREVGLCAFDGGPGVRLEEIKLYGTFRGRKFTDNFYRVWRFRPAVSTELGMSILRGILKGQRVPENV